VLCITVLLAVLCFTVLWHWAYPNPWLTCCPFLFCCDVWWWCVGLWVLWYCGGVLCTALSLIVLFQSCVLCTLCGCTNSVMVVVLLVAIWVVVCADVGVSEWV
jgi:hypothetical protein